jgi:hypothetical protein
VLFSPLTVHCFINVVGVDFSVISNPIVTHIGQAHAIIRVIRLLICIFLSCQYLMSKSDSIRSNQSVYNLSILEKLVQVEFTVIIGAH